MKRLIDVYPYRLSEGDPQFLIFKRSSVKIYKHQWRMVGGKVQKDEYYWEGALRELREETGLIPLKFWTIPSVNQFYEAKTDTIHRIPAFAAEIDENAAITLNEEHTEYKWVQADEINNYIPWPEQRRLMNLLHDLLTDPTFEIIPEWIIDIN